MSLIQFRLVLPLSFALLFTLGNKGCHGLKLPGHETGGIQGGADAGPIEDAGPDKDAAQGDAGESPDEDAGSGALVCGRLGGSCDASEFCNFEPDRDCGDTDRGGRCEAIPQICTAIFDPVCGCDLRSYSSACNAHGNGVSVLHGRLCTAD
jgi:hypothetical protein